MKKNPYTILFGKEPTQFIERPIEAESIIDSFEEPELSEQVFMITGVRGSGKTVFMTEITRRLKENPDWIIVELSSESNLLEDLASWLASQHVLAQIFQNAKINLSFWGFGLEVSGTSPITNIQLAITKMLESLKKHKKKVLISIDEAVNNKAMREFSSAFQIFLRQELPIYLLMTGLYKNIEELQNQKNLTFLFRAPKIALRPLNERQMAFNYKATLKISDDEASEMARLTRGYSYAFQVLGYLTWQNRGDYKAIIDTFRGYIEEYSYDKIWSELSEKDKQILRGIAITPSGKIVEIRNALNISTNEFNPYRKRLIKKGLINGEQYGYVSFTLPFFEDYVLENS